MGVIWVFFQVASLAGAGSLALEFLLLSDLTPTIGLFQPVFVALFDRYRALFLLLVHGHCVGYLVPLGLRFRCGSLPLPPHTHLPAPIQPKSAPPL